MTAEPRAVFDDIAAEYMVLPGVDIGPMFGSEGAAHPPEGVRLHGLSVGTDREAARREGRALERTGRAERMTMRGRAMREWVFVGPDAMELWPDVAAEAYAFVDRITPR